MKWRHHVHVSKKPPKAPGRSRAPRATSGRQDAELSAQAHVKCKKTFEIGEMEADHITPWSKGGRTDAANCQLLCLDDNRRKGGK